jgi:non-specific serine/threonine protein kinase
MEMELTGSANCLASGVQVGEYRLQGVVGEGGFGIVYRARDLSLDRIVAIKEYMPSTLAGRMSSNQIHVRAQHKGAFDAGLRSFINEARLLAKFSHPALVHVYRFFEANGTAYMVMRYYEGQTFRAFLSDQANGLNERWLCAMLSPILDVLEMLHEADCFHRDIAPDNVFLQASGMPVLLDFGAARRIIGDMTQALTMVLKPGFAPIEQYADDGGMPQGAWTDVYQLGAMLYLAITGKVPTTSVARMISDPVQLLTPTDYPGYSAQFLQGVHRALAVKPTERPQSIAELKALLGIRTFTAPALSAWSASSSMPLDILSPDSGQPSNQAAQAMGQASSRVEQAAAPSPEPLATVAAVNRVQDDLKALLESRSTMPDDVSTGLPAQNALASGAESSANLNPAEASRKVAESWVVPPIVTVPLGVAPDVQRTPAESEPPVERRRPKERVDDELQSSPNSDESKRQAPWSWRTSAVVGCVALALVGGWLLIGAEPEPVQTQASIAEGTSWDEAKKIGTVESLQRYLDAFPNGDYAQEARSMLITLAQGSAEAIRPSDTSGTSAKENTQAEIAADSKATAVSKLQDAVQPPVVAAPSTKATAVAVGASAPVLTGIGAPRSATETAKSDAPAIVLTEPKKQVPVEMGKVTLRIAPWGNVRVNRASVGTTPPLTQLDLPEGQHQIEISNPAGPSVTRVVQVKKDEPVVFSHKFE